MKSPCVADCPNRLPCGDCRAACKEFQKYEAERLKDTPFDTGSITAGRKSKMHSYWRDKRK